MTQQERGKKREKSKSAHTQTHTHTLLLVKLLHMCFILGLKSCNLLGCVWIHFSFCSSSQLVSIAGVSIYWLTGEFGELCTSACTFLNLPLCVESVWTRAGGWRRRGRAAPALIPAASPQSPLSCKPAVITGCCTHAAPCFV